MDLAVLGLSAEGCGEANGARSGAGISFTQAKQAMHGWATGLARSQGATLSCFAIAEYTLSLGTPPSKLRPKPELWLAATSGP